MDKKCGTCTFWCWISKKHKTGTCRRDGTGAKIRNADNGTKCDGYEQNKQTL